MGKKTVNMKIIKTNIEYQPWHGVLLIAILFVALILGIVQKLEQQKSSTEDLIVQNLTQDSCEDSGGMWDSCGSACRGQAATNEDVACIELCVEHCYCLNDGQCPADHHCSEKVDNIGVCKLDN